MAIDCLHFEKHKSGAIVIDRSALVHQIMASLNAVEYDHWPAKDTQVKNIGPFRASVSRRDGLQGYVERRKYHIPFPIL